MAEELTAVIEDFTAEIASVAQAVRRQKPPTVNAPVNVTLPPMQVTTPPANVTMEMAKGWNFHVIKRDTEGKVICTYDLTATPTK
jgi:hypothetical protein